MCSYCKKKTLWNYCICYFGRVCSNCGFAEKYDASLKVWQPMKISFQHQLESFNYEANS